MQTLTAWRGVFGLGLVFLALVCSVVAAAEPKIDVAKLKPGDKLEYQELPGKWTEATYVRPGAGHTLWVQRPPFKQPVLEPINLLRIPAEKPGAATGGADV